MSNPLSRQGSGQAALRRVILYPYKGSGQGAVNHVSVIQARGQGRWKTVVYLLSRQMIHARGNQQHIHYPGRSLGRQQ